MAYMMWIWEEAVKYVLDKEHRYCLEKGVEPLFLDSLK
jgi:hypothetical protein